MELIEREALKICKHSNGYGYCIPRGELCQESPCEKEERVEYAPVVHGWWDKDCTEEGRVIVYFCSVCGVSLDSHSRMSYCPNCGARMDGGNDDG